MHGFRYTRRGPESRLEPEERYLLAQVVADVAQLLGAVLVDGPDGIVVGGPDAMPGGAERPSPRADGSPRDGVDAPARPSDAEILAALDFDPAEDARRGMTVDPALDRLLPPASKDDAELAAEWRRLTGGELRAVKTARLARVFRELRAPTGSGGRVLVASGTEGDWLATLTDVRLVLASRLGVEDDDDVERVHRLAQGDPVPPRERPARGPGVGDVTDDPWDEDWDAADLDEERDEADEQLEVALASLYTALTWWQESLLQSMGDPGDRT